SVSVGSHASGTLGGTGTVGTVLVYDWGNVDPGVNGSGVLHCASAVFNSGSTFTARLGTQLSATGKIDLSGGPTLAGPLGFFPQFAAASILQGASVVGTFKNTFVSNGNIYLVYGSELFLVQYTSTGLVLTRVA